MNERGGEQILRERSVLLGSTLARLHARPSSKVPAPQHARRRALAPSYLPGHDHFRAREAQVHRTMQTTVLQPFTCRSGLLQKSAHL